jgi:tetratricopeptide (TPR) repeat protein
MKNAIRKGDWQTASEYCDAVLEKHGDEPDTIALVAQVAHSSGDVSRGADLLVRACEAESFSNSARIQQAMVALVGVGKLYDGIDMLEEAIAKQPDDLETRRWLYDFYMGTENRHQGLVHGKILVRARKFDLELLTTLSNTERRTLDAKPLEEMTSRNPDDQRPLVGDAKIKFDEGAYGDAIELLESIVAQHPDYVPAQTLLGRSLAAAGRMDALVDWAGKQQQPVAASPDYWLALGDWSRAQNDSVEATRAYWEATQTDPDLLEAWSKLSQSMQTLPSGNIELDPDVRSAIERRATLLSQFNQLKSRFERSGSISRATVAEMVSTLVQLGRLWEAEAWASIAYTLPEDDSVRLDELRAGIIRELKSKPDWQVVADRPEFSLNLASLPVPRVGHVLRPTQDGLKDGGESNSVSALKLVNEADERGLRFAGFTSDKLDQPGIMLHETLGCGGATIDFDLDGWSDLYLVAAGGQPPNKDSHSNALMRNIDGRFKDATIASAAGDRGFGQGVAVADLNADGFPDLMVLNYGPNTLLLNNGDGTFRDASDHLPVNDARWSTSAAVADLDADGISDISITNYCAGLEPTTTKCPMKGSEMARSCSPMMFPAAVDQFLKGSADGGFSDATEAWGARPTVPGRGLGIVVGEFDGGSGLDVFVANDMTNNHFWSRPKDAESDEYKLVESAMVRGLGADDRAIAQGSMGIATGDLDQDGDLDLYVTNFDNEYNTFHEQIGRGAWRDETLKMGLLAPTTPVVGFGCEAVDLNNDGRLELIVANGHVDMFSRQGEESIYAQPLQVFQRSEQGRFDSVGESMSGEYLQTPHVARALWTIDVDKNGSVDFAITHQTEQVALLLNQSQKMGDWVRFELTSPQAERDSVGAKLEISVGEKQWVSQKLAGHGYLCTNDSRVHVGLGDLSDQLINVQVTWPDGSVEKHEDLAINSDWLLIQGQEPFQR